MDIPAIPSAVSDLDRYCDYGNYGIEILCANWTPMVAVIAEPVSRACELPVEVAATDIDTFLKRFYDSQRG